MSNDLNNKIDTVEKKITSTEKEIEETKEKLKNPRDANEAHSWETLRQLRDEKNKYLDEKNKYLDEKNKYLDLEISLANKAAELLKKQNLKEENRLSKSFLYLCAKA
jgi:hypothetical protein